MNIQQFLFYALFGTILIVFLLALLSTWASTPIVIFQYPSGDCIEVQSPRVEDTCENMPKRFTYEWKM